MPSLRRHEGYLLVDHRDSPGVPERTLVVAGLPLAAGRGLYESATFTCSHCCRVVVMNPQRTRSREYCARCDHLICDDCGKILAAGGDCKPYQQFVDEVQKAAGKGGIIPVTL